MLFLPLLLTLPFPTHKTNHNGNKFQSRLLIILSIQPIMNYQHHSKFGDLTNAIAPL